MCVVLPLLLASALHLFCFIICRGHPEFMDFRRLLFDYEVSSFNVEIMCEIIWLVATISFLFISLLKTLSVSHLSSLRGLDPFTRPFPRFEESQWDEWCWQQWLTREGDMLMTRFALLFFVLEGYLTMDAHWRGPRDLDLFTGNECMTWLCFPIVLFVSISNYALWTGWISGIGDGFHRLGLCFFLILILTASVTYTFGILSSGKPRPWNGLWMTKKSGTRYGYSHFA